VRTGPFSDPAIVTLSNRYFIPVHLDNTDGSARRYGMEPGHENAYILLETPEIAGGPKVKTVILGRLSQVLEVPNARKEIQKFLKAHREFQKPWPELAQVASATDPESRIKRAELLLDEGDVDAALRLIPSDDRTPRAQLLRARAYRVRQRWNQATSALANLPASPEADLERVRLAFDRMQDRDATALLDRWLASNPDHPEADEAYFMRGWLSHRAKDDDRAVEIWQAGMKKHPLTQSLFSQKAQLTMIRLNWDLPEGVDQEK
jgi:tetratricopeptide (TPR) repeat protein